MSDPRSEHDSPTRKELLDQLLFECLERIDQTDATLDSVLAEVASEHPGLVEDLRTHLETLRETGLLETAAGDDSFPDSLGDFRLLRRLGSGGMGVVFLAEQRSMNREIALKLLRPEQRFQRGARVRFQREVEAAARLSHPHVVPVYLVGEENGVPYLAMEFVRGCSLDRALRALDRGSSAHVSALDLRETLAGVLAADGFEDVHDWNEEFWRGSWSDLVLRIALCVAKALEHAHERGVLHRDVKPSNVIVTPEGRVLLCDFGLAIFTDADRMTRTGAELGSLPYMAPEQLEGGHVDHRTDVYGLGVTLYELLTRHSPFLDQASTERTRQRILAGRPPALRRFDPSSSRDLQTVCMVAMERDPARRYPSAGALARDLTNLLEHRPIEARPTGPWVHLLRWVQRYPALAATSAALLLALILGPTLYALQELRSARVIKSEGERALRHRDRSLRAIDTFLTQVGARGLKEVPRLTALRSQLLDEAEGLYREILAEGEDVRRGLAWVLVDRGGLRRTEARLEQAQGDLDEAAELLAALLAEQPDDAQVQHKLGVVAVERGAIELIREDGDAALVFYEEARRWFEGLLDQADPERVIDLASALGGASRVHLQRARYAESEQVLREALDLLTPHAAADPLHAGLALREARLLRDLLNAVTQGGGAVDQAPEIAARAVERFEVVRGSEEWSAHLDREVSSLESIYGNMLRQLGRNDDAAPHFERAVELMARLNRDFPGLSYLDELFVAQNNLAVCRYFQGESAKSRSVFREMVDLADSARREIEPERRALWGYRHAIASSNLANTLIEVDEYDEAFELAAAAEETLMGLLEATPGHRMYAAFLGGALEAQVKVHLARDDLEQVDRAIDRLESIGVDPVKEKSTAARLAAQAALQAESSELRARGVRCLAEAVEAGWQPAPALDHGDWDALRGEAAFEALRELLEERGGG